MYMHGICRIPGLSKRIFKLIDAYPSLSKVALELFTANKQKKLRQNGVRERKWFSSHSVIPLGNITLWVARFSTRRRSEKTCDEHSLVRRTMFIRFKSFI